MDASAGFFAMLLAFQLLLTAALVALVGRSRPAMLPLYRWLAPAALPVLMLVLIGSAALRGARGVALDRVVVSYLVLWLVGVLAAGLVIRFGGWRR